jgi:hypothetical protein
LQTVKRLMFTRKSAFGDIVGMWHWHGQYCRKIAGKRRAGSFAETGAMQVHARQEAVPEIMRRSSVFALEQTGSLVLVS